MAEKNLKKRRLTMSIFVQMYHFLLALFGGRLHPFVLQLLEYIYTIQNSFPSSRFHKTEQTRVYIESQFPRQYCKDYITGAVIFTIWKHIWCCTEQIIAQYLTQRMNLAVQTYSQLIALTWICEMMKLVSYDNEYSSSGLPWTTIFIKSFILSSETVV